VGHRYFNFPLQLGFTVQLRLLEEVTRVRPWCDQNGDKVANNQNTQDKAKEAAKDKAQEAQDRAREVKDQVKAQAQEAKEQATAKAQEKFEQGKGRLVSQVQGVANAFRKTSEQLREEEQGDLAAYTEQLAEQVERLSSYLEDKGLKGVTRDLEGLARQRPALFVGGALVLGLVAVRFLRSSSSESPQR